MGLVFQILASKKVESWMKSLSNKELELLVARLIPLEQQGPNSGRPLVDQIKGSSIHNLKELRFGSNRVLFTFSSNRAALLLVAGNKAGRYETFYQEAIARADLTLERQF